MDYQELDRLISDLRSRIPSTPNLLTGHRDFIDWKALFSLAKQIQAGFNSRVRYPSAHERQQAWDRFNTARDELHRSSKADRRHRENHSSGIRSEIFYLLKQAQHPIVYLGFTVEDAKEKGRYLKEAKRVFGTKAREMIRDHKDEVYTLIGQITKEHNRWWDAHKAAGARRQQEWRNSMHERIRKAEKNRSGNVERLEKAANALARTRMNLARNAVQLAEARSDDYRRLVEGWIREGQERERDIEQQIDRYHEWINEDDRRISEMRDKLRN